ncbi:FG-GAP-like repeat-containing protein [Flavobacterium restrictum]|uniref:T9SS sorting signal type C domain-containing protein n=1 Tax=Flavobacterium restrictum TaxID=2594428 RepID=A0A553DWC0_9FLAO|nr:FG-GAP-like repeat-containing protein [Flavobacterium restrictum]TRX37096.1 hypothetical protein FNW21_12950 [Flavobacterium restrictum]
MKQRITQTLLLFLMIFGISKTQAQDASKNWVKAMGGSSPDFGTSIVTDASGNVYTTGTFSGTVDFDPSSAGTTTLTSVGGSDIFVQKLDASGNLVWAKSMGGSNADSGKSISVDSSGNVYVTGYFQETVDFDPSSTGTTTLTSVRYLDIFVQKLDALGNLVWAKSMGGSSDDYGNGITVDSSGNVYTTGSFINTADFDPSPTGTFNLIAAGKSDIFVQKLDASGNLVWAKAMGRSSIDSGYGISVDSSGNVYTTGFFQGTVDFDPSSTSITTLTAVGNSDIYVQKLNASGNFVWAKAMGGSSGDIGYGITVDSSGNVYTTGYFTGAVDFDPSSTGTFNLTPVGIGDIFVQKLDASGNFVWAKSMGGSSDDYGYGISVDTSGNVYTTGLFQGTVDFDPSSTGNTNLTALGGQDIFVQKLDASGNLVWAKAMGGSSDDYGYGISVDTSGNVYTTGLFQGTADFDPSSTSATNLVSSGSYDIFVQKMGQVTATPTNNAVVNINSSMTADVVADGTTVSGSTTANFDGSSQYLMSSTFSQFGVPTSFLPNNNTFTSARTASVSYSLAPYNASNSLRITGTNSGTITVSMASNFGAKKLYVLAATGGASSTTNLTINFSDGTSQSVSGVVVGDWYSGTNFALKGFGRTSTTSIDNNADNPRLYEMEIAIDAANQAKNITSIVVAKTTSNGVLNVMGLSYEKGTQTVCNLATVADLQMNGSNIKWYTTATGGSPLSSSLVLTNNTTYYANQTINDFESATRTALTITVISNVPVPTAATPQVYTGSGTIANLTATGTSLKWYGNSTGGSPLATTTALVNGITYYVSQTPSSCESARVAVTAITSPVITSFTPANAKPGDVVTILGTGFNTTVTNDIVFFGATKATITAATATSLTVTVPAGATYAPITFLNTGTTLACYSLTNFNPIYSPAKSSLKATDFTPKVGFATETGISSSVAIGDLDGDGKPDLAVIDGESKFIAIYRNTATSGNVNSGSFAPKVVFATGDYSRSIAIGDLDGDGKPDLAIANPNNSTVSVLRNTATSGAITTSSFAAKVDFTTGKNPYSVAIGDLDGDGKMDLAVANLGSNTVSLYRNKSSVGVINSSSFSTKVDFVMGTYPYSVAIGDLDSDGKPDLAVANYSSSNVSVLRNTATSGALTTSSFATKVDFSTGSSSQSVAIGDLDGDGKPDLAVANSYSISVLRNTATSGTITTNSFAYKVDFTTDYVSSLQSVAIGDFDGDSKPDLAVVDLSSSTVSVLRNNATSGAITISSFASKVDFATGKYPRSVAIGDLDGDGRPDLAVSSGGGGTSVSSLVSVLRNAGTNSYLSSLTTTAGAISPVFATATTAYTATVPNTTTTTTLTPTIQDVSATVQMKVNGGSFTAVTSGEASIALALNEGSNTIEVKVTAQNGDVKSYYLVVCRTAIPMFTTIAPLCQGSSFTLPTTSNNGIIGTWSPAINTAATTVYTFTPDASQCVDAAQMTVTIGNTTTWTVTSGTGSWDNGTPTSTSKAIINGNYSEAVNLEACSLEVTGTAVVTVPTGFNFTVSGKVTVATTASLTFANNANLVQVDEVANDGKITSKRNSAALMLLDYTLWSSPVAGQQLQGFSSATLSNRFYIYNPATDKYNAATPTANFATGTGYLIRMPNNHPTTPTIWNGSFTGIPNNGTVSLTVTSNTYNGIGNPYPSTISADAFIDANAITESLYFWRKTNNAATTSYATYTKAGGTANAGGLSSIVPSGTIQVGQGFLAKSTSTALIFTNAMRTANNTAPFLKTKAIEKSRIWLNLAKDTAPANQMMVAYMTGATAGIDAGIEGKYFNDSPIALNSIIDNEEFVIQGKGLPFADTDIVPLTFKTNATGNFTISIDHVDGLFSGSQDVFLNDKTAGTSQDLKKGAYTFAATKGTFNNRFELVYKSSAALGIDEQELSNSVLVFKQNGLIHINAGKTVMKTVRVYDMQGRLIFKQEKVNQNTTILKGFTAAEQTILVQITSDEDKIVTKKVMY